MKFLGYRRADGAVGIRNYLGILPASICANGIAIDIANDIRGVIALPHNGRCTYLGKDEEIYKRTLVGFGNNPNLGAVLVVGVGCEVISAETLADLIRSSGKMVHSITIGEKGDYYTTVQKGKETAYNMLGSISKEKREEADIGSLTLGIKCGGSDATSGISGNVATGAVADIIIEEGGTVIFTETAELIGAEHILMKRAVNADVAEKIYKTIMKKEKSINSMGVDMTGHDPTPGNIEQGLTTIEEKSLGAVAKGGNKPIQGVLEWGEKPKNNGLYIMDGPAITTCVCSGFAAAGAQAMIFSLGDGLPAKLPLPALTGTFPIMPIIKLTGNPKGYAENKKLIDVYVGSIIEGQESIEEAAQRAFNELLSYISGERNTVVESVKEPVWPMDLYITGPMI
jgi:altronate dehydratase large subunit